MNPEQIAKFIQDYFAWTYLPYQGRGATCDKEAFMNWQCCPFHRQGLQERERFQHTARAIARQFPTFYQEEQHPSVLTQDWFLRLSEVSEVPLPDKKMATWLYAEISPQAYQEEALRTLYPDLSVNERLGLCGLGLVGETGEVADMLKKYLYHRNGKPLDVEKLKDELGDVLWYYFILLDTLGLTFEEMVRTDVPKYERRRAVFSGLDSKGQLEFCGLELASNLGQVVDLLSRLLYYYHGALDVNDLKDRLGDMLWYMLLLLGTLGLTFEEVLSANVAKCRTRHANGFNPRYTSDSHVSE